jgi:hypothetical protein
MKLDVNVKTVGKIDTSILKKIEEAFVEEDWFVYDYRRPMFSETEENGTYNSIMIRHSSEYKNESIRNMPLYDKYHPLIEPVLTELKKYYNYEDYVAFFARLQPGAGVGLHNDDGEFLDCIHRVHVPITTNEKSIYVVDNEEFHWKVGTMYEFDNMRIHGAHNHGGTGRVHLIVNLYPTGTLKNIQFNELITTEE